MRKQTIKRIHPEYTSSSSSSADQYIEEPVEYHVQCIPLGFIRVMSLVHRRGSRRCFGSTKHETNGHQSAIRLFPARFSRGFLSQKNSSSRVSARPLHPWCTIDVVLAPVLVTTGIEFQKIYIINYNRKSSVIRPRVYKQTKFLVIYLR